MKIIIVIFKVDVELGTRLDNNLGRRKFDANRIYQLEKEDIKRKIMIGAVYLDQEDELKVFVLTRRSCFECFCSCLESIVDCIVPLSGNVKHFKVHSYIHVVDKI